MTTRLEIAVKRRAARKLTGGLNRVSLGMLLEIVSVKAFADDLSVVNEHRAYHRVGADQPGALPSQNDCAVH